MGRSVNIRVTDKTRRNIESILGAGDCFNDGIRNALFDIGSKHISVINSLFKSPKHGKFYNGHRASAPGEPLAAVTGKLLRTAGYKVRGNDELEVGLNTLYAKHWEKDVPENKRRTTLLDAVDNSRRNFENDLLSYVQREIEKKAK